MKAKDDQWRIRNSPSELCLVCNDWGSLFCIMVEEEAAIISSPEWNLCKYASNAILF